MEVGQRLQQRRVTLQMTQEKVAEAIGISRQTLSNWENGRSFPDIERVVRLSELYDLSLDNLLKGDPELVTHLQRNTSINHTFKIFIWLLIVNGLLMIAIMLLPHISAALIYLMIGLSTIISLGTFYLIIKKL